MRDSTFMVKSDTLEFDYVPRWTSIVWAATLFGLSTVVLGYKAASNDRGLIINRVIELGPESATVFYWVLTILSGGFVAIAVFLTYRRVVCGQRLVLARTTLTIPASQWSRKEKEIAYAHIHGLSETTVNGQRFLNLEHAGGTDTITASMLPTMAAYEEVGKLLAAKVGEAHTS
jgi:hypothetical protein